MIALALLASLTFSLPVSHQGFRWNLNPWSHAWQRIPLTCPTCEDSIGNAFQSKAPPYRGVKVRIAPSVGRFFLAQSDSGRIYRSYAVGTPAPGATSVTIPDAWPGYYFVTWESSGGARSLASNPVRVMP